MTRVVITNARLILKEGATSQTGSLLIENGHIAAVGVFNAPPDCETVDAGGLTLAPGIVDYGVFAVDAAAFHFGGITRAVKRARGGQEAPVYITDATRGRGTVRTLGEQVALETRTRMLNPHFYEALLRHGYEGVRQIESHLTNTFGWSATTGQVQPWVYQQVTETFVLDAAMRERLAKLNPAASVHLAQRLLEASERRYWQPTPEVLAALREASEELEDRLEGVYEGAPA